VTARNKLHRLVDELSEAEVEAALTRLLQEREAVEHGEAVRAVLSAVAGGTV
jgi:hypothetical protein